MTLHTSALEGSRAHPRVTYRFHTAADPSAGWQVVRAQIEERISAPYEAVVALTGGPGLTPARMLGKSCTLEVWRGEHVRPVHGIVRRVETRASDVGARVEVTLVPALGALALGSDCRIFADRSVPEVVEAVLGPGLRAYGRSLVKRLRRTYPVREYVVQYRESDLAFATRLLAEEGIWYHFEHPAGRADDVAERLCLVDDNEEAPEAKLGADGPALPLERDHAGLAYHEAITDLVASASLGSTGVTVRAFNWTHPSVVAESTVPRDPGPRARYVPEAVHFAGYADGRYATSDAEAQAANAWEGLRGAMAHARCTGNVTRLAPGQRVELVDAHAGTQRWIVTRVHAAGRDAANTERTLQHLEDYQCQLELAPADLPLRPLPCEKPRAHGVQTGRVVGPDGRAEVEPGADDVHVDPHGRVRVKLAWDRSEPGADDATVTCFLRVAQAWAGRGFGLHFTPRVGMEVVVSFLDGDPDRPLVTGCVYNGLNQPPFRLPAEKARSGIVTRSTPGEEGANALVLDDAVGQECVTLRAQRDHVVQVSQKQTVAVGADRSLRVGGSEVVHIAGSRHTLVQGREQLACTGGRAVGIEGGDRLRVGGTHHIEVTKEAEALFGGGRKVRVVSSDALEVTEDKRDHIEGKYHLRAEEGLVLAQGGAWLQLRNSELDSFAVGTVRLANAAFELHDDGRGNTTLTADRSVVIEVGKSRLSLQADGTIDLRGVQCRVHSGASELCISADSAALKSTRTSIDGTTQTTITGKMVKIN